MEGYRYPKAAEVKKSAAEVMAGLITDYPTDLTKDAMKKLTAGMDALYGYALIYQSHIEQLPANHDTLVERLPGYEPLPKNIQVKYREGLKSAHKEAIDEVSRIVNLMKSFTKHLNQWEPEHFNDIMQVQDELNL